MGRKFVNTCLNETLADHESVEQHETDMIWAQH